jgi:hypothetical protein
MYFKAGNKYSSFPDSIQELELEDSGFLFKFIVMVRECKEGEVYTSD